MRLFIAVNFSPNALKKIEDIGTQYKKHTLHGNFSHRENLHLTLVFLGEVAQSELKKVFKAMNIESEKFRLEFSNPGLFKRSEGDILWLGIKQSKALNELQKKLSRNLVNMGFALEDRRFTPHITLARQVEFKAGFEPMKYEFLPFFDEVGRISLMKSERIRGKLTYTEIYGKNLI